MIMIANQRPAMKNFVTFASKLLNFIIIIILTKTTEGSIVKVGFVFSFSPVIVLSISSIYFYLKDYKQFVPSIKMVNFKYSKGLMNLGTKFLIIQLAVIILFTTDNMIITRLFSPADVTVYNVAHKYFNIVLMSFSIIVAPFWSSITDAYHKQDFKWIRNSVSKLQKLWLIFFTITVIMLVSSNWVYSVWLRGKDIQVPFALSFAWALYVLMQTYNSIFVNFINGVGKVKLQVYTAIFSITMNIPLSVFFAKTLNLGVKGVIMGTMVSTLLSLILRPLQYYKIINNKAKGIWNK
jgi:O-antigen/teichoic acid export membrane protein